MSLVDGPVRIGLMFARTPQPLNWAGLECIEAAHVTLAMLEDAGAVPAGRVTLLDGDVHDAASGLAEARRFVEREDARILFGTIVSERVLPAAEYAQERGLLYWESVAASQAITDRVRNFFRVNVDAVPYGIGMVDFAAKEIAPLLGVRPADLRVAIVRQPREFADSLVPVMERALRERGVPHVGSLSVDAAAEDLRPVIRRLRELDPHVVLAAVWSGPVPRLYAQALELGWRPPALVGTGAWALGHNVRSLGDDLDGIFAAGTPHVVAMSRERLSERARHELAEWSRRTEKPHSDGTSVDRDLVVLALQVLLRDVLAQARSWDLAELRRAALAVDIPLGDTILGYGVRFTERGDNERSFPAIMQWQHGRLETVSPDLIATARPLPA